MYLCLNIFILLDFINGISSDISAPRVSTPLGGIKGLYGVSYSGRPYERYLGIPYALPPIDTLRFEPPRRIKKWHKTISAETQSTLCIQYQPQQGPRRAKIVGAEDCLYLNVFVPVHNRSRLLPVLFSIHGGGYQFSRGLINVTFLMDKDVIFVSMNYRLGIFGFVSTEDKHIPGNMGLKDQSMALLWTSQNIQYFGGDPKRITLIGNSAGAASVHFHYLSPMSKGMFRNGISFSSSALTAGNIHQGSLEKFKKLAALLKCPTKYISSSIKCLRKRPAHEIIKKTENFWTWLSHPITPFGPVVERGSVAPFIDRHPVDIINTGDAADIPWIIDIVSGDGLYPGAAFLDNDNYLKELDEQWNFIAPHLLMYNFTVPISFHDYYSTHIRQHYFGSNRINKNNANALISLLGDRLYCFGIIKAAKLQAKQNKSPIFLWSYNYRALDGSFSNYIMKNPVNYGACHSDDLFMIMGNNIIDPTKNEEDRAVQIKLIDMVVSVADEGYPSYGENVEWKMVQKDDEGVDMLYVDNAIDIKMVRRDNPCEYDFWKEMDTLEKQV